MQINDVPIGLPESLIEHRPNEPIVIHHGEILLKKGEQEALIDGKISFVWQPEMHLIFKGTISEKENQLNDLAFCLSGQPMRVYTSSVDFGQASITKMRDGWLSGRILGDKVVGDLEAEIDRVTFLIPNMKHIAREPVSFEQGKYSGLRLSLENADFKIILEENTKFRDTTDLLRDEGGYCIQYYGEAIKKSGNFRYSDANTLAKALSTFLSFVIGQRTSLLFLTGTANGNVVWKDYGTKSVDRYKVAPSWFHRDKNIDLQAVWVKFSEMWADPDQKSYLRNVISFYLESNCNKVFIENCIVITQAAMELLYNWQFVDKGIGKETDTAAVKLSALIKELGLKNNIPSSLVDLKLVEQTKFVDKTAKSQKSIISAIDAYLEIRNAIIHGNAWRRMNLAKINTDSRIDAWILGNWYLELWILKILSYQGHYNNRTVALKHGYSSMETVPWSETAEDNDPSE